MRVLIAALLACAATGVSPGQTQAGAKNGPAPRATLPQTWENAQRSFAEFGARTDVPGGANAGVVRSLDAPPQMVARNQGAVPIPGEWPNLKKELIPTTWPKLKLLLIDGGTQAKPAPKK